MLLKFPLYAAPIAIGVGIISTFDAIFFSGMFLLGLLLGAFTVAALAYAFKGNDLVTSSTDILMLMKDKQVQIGASDV